MNVTCPAVHPMRGDACQRDVSSGSGKPAARTGVRSTEQAAIVVVAAAAAVVMSHATRWWSDAFILNCSLFFHTFQWRFVPHLFEYGFAGWTGAVVHFMAAAALEASLLVWWSWCIGLLLQRLDASTQRLAVIAFLVLLFAATLGTSTTTRLFNAERFANVVQTSAVIALVRAGLVMLPLAMALMRKVPDHLDRRVGIGIAMVGVLLIAWAIPELTSAMTSGRIAANMSVSDWRGVASPPSYTPMLLACLGGAPAALLLLESFRIRS